MLWSFQMLIMSSVFVMVYPMITQTNRFSHYPKNGVVIVIYREQLFIALRFIFKNVFGNLDTYNFVNNYDKKIVNITDPSGIRLNNDYFELYKR